MVTKAVPITQILLLAEPDRFPERLTPTILAVFEEVRRFYESDDWLDVPLRGGQTASVRPEWTAEQVADKALSPDGVVVDRDLVARIADESRSSPTTHDQSMIGELLLRSLQPPGTAVIVTDLAITPPPDWRYVIWDVVPGCAVVSLATLDPFYWAMSVDEEERTRVIKRRARAACLSIVGTLLGLSRCENERCYLFAGVDSALRLDEMVYLGPEHRVETLGSRSYPHVASDPVLAETIVPPLESAT
jgi:hypothetical protein